MIPFRWQWWRLGIACPDVLAVGGWVRLWGPLFWRVVDTRRLLR